jgi:hypothetical protein
MAQANQIEGITIYDDEELLHHVKTSILANLFRRRNLVLGLCTSGAWSVYVYLKHKSSTEYIITDERIVTKSGNFATSTEQTSFEDIVGDVTTEQNIFQSLFGIGNIQFQIQKTRETTGKSGQLGEREKSQRELDIRREVMRLEGIKEHQKVANAIRRMQRQS